ncbi:nitrile hydratase subunit beta [Mycolicibacterium goodii]|uniref:nitrile hydratase subunit beta n=1 Tax=Mycolicibacterium goodii TaxID=134601 RepID=UPI000C267B9D|nr:nitrile hydratase subunit beta [Mycolicibacterium goodii]MBU8808400.1 nitrile hydratase subunit beta [Mycolicibacterium goodii]PJK18280.1 nitrile hydratase subunit beta [Mycolicibacterium goodii]ULN48134.1 nitrile hydratase subunit beta [Mycolicibacterium goodii]
MKLQHFIGGMEGLTGPLDLDKRVFVEDWEKRIFGIHVAMMALSTHLDEALPGYPIADVPTTFREKWTWAHLRTGAEGMNPFDYFRFRYYEKWLGGISQFFIDKGYVSEGEIRSALDNSAVGESVGPGATAIDDQVVDYLRRGDSPRRGPARPRFSPGDTVRIADVPAGAHTRLPGYLRGRIGTVRRSYEGEYCYFVHTDDGIGDPMPIYVVEFDPRELWGSGAEAGASALYADLFEAYLKPVEEDQ